MLPYPLGQGVCEPLFEDGAGAARHQEFEQLEARFAPDALGILSNDAHEPLGQIIHCLELCFDRADRLPHVPDQGLNPGRCRRKLEEILAKLLDEQYVHG